MTFFQKRNHVYKSLYLLLTSFQNKIHLCHVGSSQCKKCNTVGSVMSEVKKKNYICISARNTLI